MSNDDGFPNVRRDEHGRFAPPPEQWWQGSDGRWYPPPSPPPLPVTPPAPENRWWLASDGLWYPPQDATATPLPPPTPPPKRRAVLPLAAVGGVVGTIILVASLMALSSKDTTTSESAATTTTVAEVTLPPRTSPPRTSPPTTSQAEAIVAWAAATNINDVFKEMGAASQEIVAGASIGSSAGYPRIQRGCSMMRSAVDKIPATLPSPDSGLTVELRTAYEHYSTAATACLRFIVTEDVSDLETAGDEMGLGTDAVKRATAILDDL